MASGERAVKDVREKEYLTGRWRKELVKEARQGGIRNRSGEVFIRKEE